MLEIVSIALDELLRTQNVTVTNKDRIKLFKDIIDDKFFTRQDYLRHNKEISSATASRDLKDAVSNGIVEKSGDKRLTKYRFKKN